MTELEDRWVVTRNQLSRTIILMSISNTQIGSDLEIVATGHPGNKPG